MRALRGLRLARPARGRRQRRRGHRRRHRGGQGRDGQAVAHRGAHAHRLRLAQQAGQGRGARRAARRGRGQASPRKPATGRSSRVLRGRRRRRRSTWRPASAPPSAHAAWSERFAAWRAADAVPRPESGTTPGRTSCPRAGTPTCRSSRRTTSPSRPAPPPARSSTPWRRTCRRSSAARPTWRRPTTPGSTDVSDQQAATPEGRNFHFGVREHAMAAMGNGMAAHGGLRPYVATFFVFVDYMRPAMRLSALMSLPVDLRAHARQRRRRRGRAHAPADRASRHPARHAGLRRPASGRRQRDGRGVEARPAAGRAPWGSC